jgi:hypothetical protein
MSSYKPFPENWITVFWIAVSLTLTGGCATDSEKTLEDLDKTLLIYNNAFESKDPSGGSGYVLNEYRMDYLLKYSKIRDRVTFYETQTLNMAYFKGGKAMDIDPEEEDEDAIDEAIITMRYNVTISPSNRVKTFIHEQRWKLEEESWLLEPNLKPFLN